MFSDLNRHAIRPSTSIAKLYDHRDPIAEVIRRVVYETEVFKGVVEMERSNIAERSSKLFPYKAPIKITGFFDLVDRSKFCLPQ
jgi:DNA sulfur modification protein DndB